MQSDPARRVRDVFDPTQINWVRPDLDALLTGIVDTLQPGCDHGVCDTARQGAHQVAGVLKMLGLDGGAAAAAALETALAAGAAGELATSQDASRALRNLADGLKRWLKRLGQGSDTSALELFPLYAAVLRLSRDEPAFEADLFFPDLRRRPPQPETAVSAAQVADSARRARGHFQRGLLTFLRGGGAAALAPMREALEQIERCAPSPAAYAFWWSAGGLIDALGAPGFDGGFHAKQLLARLDLQMRRLIDGAPQVAERLLRDTLYFVAASRLDSGRAAEVREVYQLDRLLPAGVLPDPERLAQVRPALAALGEGVAAAQHAWQHDGAAGALTHQLERLKPQAQLLPGSGLAELLEAMRDAALSDAGESEARTLEIASALLFLAQAIEREDVLSEGFARTAAHQRDRLAALALGHVAPGEPIPVSADAHDREVVRALAGEIGANLHQLETLLDAFFRDASKRPEGLAGLARDTGGAMRMLELDDAARLLDAVAAHMARYVEAGEPDETERQKVADGLSGLGVYLEAAAERRDDPAMLRPLLADWGLAEPEADEATPNDTVEAGLPARRDAIRDSYLTWREIPDAAFRQFYLDRLAELAGDAELIDDHALLTRCRELVARHRDLDTPTAADDDAVARLVGTLPPRSTEPEAVPATPTPTPDTPAPLEIAPPVEPVFEAVAPAFDAAPVFDAAPPALEQASPEQPALDDIVIPDFAPAEPPVAVEPPAPAPVADSHTLEFEPVRFDDLPPQPDEASTVDSAHLVEFDLPPVETPPFAAPAAETIELFEPAPTADAPDASAEPIEFALDLPMPPAEIPFQIAPPPVWEAIIEIARPVWHAVVEVAQPVWGAIVETARPEWHAVVEIARPVFTEPTPAAFDTGSFEAAPFGAEETLEIVAPVTDEAFVIEVPAAGFMPAEETVELAPEGAPPALPEDTTDPELVGIFLEEADGALVELDGAIAACRASLADRDALTVVRRVFHTLKGSGRMVGLNALGEVAWRFESLLNDWQAADRDATPALLDAASAGSALFRDWVARLNGGGGVPDALAATLDGLARVAAGGDFAPHHAPVIVVETVPETEAISIAAPDAAGREDTGPDAIEVIEVTAETVTPVEIAPPTEPTAPVDDTVVIGGVSLPRGLYDIFVPEARDRVAQVLDEVVRQRVSAVPVDDPSVRAAHTLGGIAATAGFPDLATLARALEHVWQRYTRAPLPVATIDLIETVALHLQGMVESLAGGFPPAAAPELVAALDDLELVSATTEDSPADQADTSVPVDLPPPPLPVVERRRIQDELDALVLPIFLEEADTLVPDTSAQLRAWHEAHGDETARNALRRNLHTLKGSARMAGAMRLGELLHIMENRVVETIEQGAAASAEMFDQLFGEFDRMVDSLEKLRHTNPEETPAPEAEAAAGDASPAPAGTAPATPTQAAAPASPVASARDAALTIRVRADWVDRMVNQAGEVAIARSRIESELAAVKRHVGELSDALNRLKSHVREVEIQAESQMQSTLLASADRRDFDPLEFDRFTRFQEVTRFLAESVNDIATVQHVLLARLGEADVALLNQTRLNRELQQDLLHVRMVPLNSVAERLYRTVRLGARDVERRVHLDIQGGEIEIDRSVLDRIVAPVEHLLRNSLAHGIEAPAERVAAGKAETGEIVLTARQAGNEMQLTVQDDGRGLDLGRIRAKAERLGIVRPGEDVAENRLVQLIFAPGFSTAETVTSVSGRGVGMDVVKSEIAALGGRIDVRSEAGRGIAFDIALPLTLAMMQAVVADAAGESYAIPATLVRQMLELKPAALAVALDSGEVEWRGERFPLIYLPHLLGQTDARPTADNALPVLLIDNGETRAAVLADSVTNAREIVLKPVGPQLARLAGIAGATVRGDGRVMLILNPGVLAQRYQATPPAPVAPAEPQVVAPRVLIVDDSLTVRKITSRLLTREGYRADTAKDGVEALEKLREAPADIVLLDVEMPRMDGFELARIMKGDAALRAIPIIMITSRTADKHRQHAADIGVDVYLGKPYQEQELLDRIAERIGVGIPA